MVMAHRGIIKIVFGVTQVTKKINYNGIIALQKLSNVPIVELFWEETKDYIIKLKVELFVWKRLKVNKK